MKYLVGWPSWLGNQRRRARQVALPQRRAARVLEGGRSRRLGDRVRVPVQELRRNMCQIHHTNDMVHMRVHRGRRTYSYVAVRESLPRVWYAVGHECHLGDAVHTETTPKPAVNPDLKGEQDTASLEIAGATTLMAREDYKCLQILVERVKDKESGCFHHCPYSLPVNPSYASYVYWVLGEKIIPVPLTRLASNLFGVYPLASRHRQRAHLSHAVGIQVPQIPPQHPAKGSPPAVPPRRSSLRNPPAVPEPEPAAMPDHQSVYGRAILATDEQQHLTCQHSNEMSTTNSLDSFSFGIGTEIILQSNHQVIYVPRVTGLTGSAGLIGLSAGLSSSLGDLG
ncbi:hypothetical protein FB451DRAFT_1467480 [Mycena latifolia]|nr:hypothetical protein FB451DRAFT_1467480 [Mycena latifolia]